MNATRWIPGCLLLLPLLGGCGGAPCGGADTGGPNPAYAGSYSGTYTNTRSYGGSGAARDLIFAIAIDPNGRVTGTVTEPGTQRQAEITGSLYDFDYACSDDKTFCDLGFTFDGEQRRRFAGSRPIGQTQPWPFSVDSYDLGNERIGAGRLELSKQ